MANQTHSDMAQRHGTEVVDQQWTTANQDAEQSVLLKKKKSMRNCTEKKSIKQQDHKR